MGFEKPLNEPRLNKSQSVDIYRPPPLRNTTTENVNAATATIRTLVSSKSHNNPQQQQTCTNGNAMHLKSSKIMTDNTTTTTTATSKSCNNSPTHANENINFDNSVTSNTMNMTCEATATLAIPQMTDATTTKTTTNINQQRQQQQQQPMRQRRPDRKIYIPRPRRSQTTPPTTQIPVTTSITTNTNTTKISTLTGTGDNSGTWNGIGAADIQQQQLPLHSDTTSKADGNKKKNKSVSVKDFNQKLLNNKINNDENIINDVTSQSRIFIKQQPIEDLGSAVNVAVKSDNINKNCDKEQRSVESNEIISQLIENQINTERNDNKKNSYDQPASDFKESEVSAEIILVNEMNAKKGKVMKKTKEINKTVEDNTLRIEDIDGMAQNCGLSTPMTAKCDSDEQELKRASKEINRSNRRIIKQTFDSNVLEIPDKILAEDENKHQRNVLTVKTKHNNLRSVKNLSEDENDANGDDGDDGSEEQADDWENMFDESGDCLDPKIMQELEASVGKVKIEFPKMDYSAFLTKQALLKEEEYPHVLEISNFPVEFKDQDLYMMFQAYKESGFDIKWVDDTHALAVFSSARIAAEILTMGHPFVVLKPLAEATMESRLKAKKCAASLQPYRQRPETCAALARRLVTGALGVRLETAAAERENEKRVLRAAKERKLLAAKQRNEAWDS